ncbi:MAG: TonB-dependent receptor plug domain-containing protein, partial [Verrucomicrobium sp.]
MKSTPARQQGASDTKRGRATHLLLPTLSVILLTANGPEVSAQATAPAPTTSPPSIPSEQLKSLTLEELMKVQVATVTTASKRSEKATEAPGTVLVIDQTDINLRGYTTLTDVLRDLPGMDVSEYLFTEIGSQAAVRGITGNNKIVVLVNGMRVNPPGGEYFPLRSDFSVRGAEQIEVIYGPGSTLYGQDAISAVINVKTKTPPADGKTHLQGAMEGGFHAERELWGSFGKIFDVEERISLTGYVQYHDSELSRLDREYPAWWKDFKTAAQPRGRGTSLDRKDQGLNAFARFEYGDFSLQSWYRESERSSSEGYGPAVLAFLPEARWQDRSWVTEAKHTWHMTDKVSLDSALTYNWYEVAPHSRYIFPADETSWFFNDYKYAQGTSFSIEETLKIEFSPTVSALIGGIYTNYDIIPKSTVPGGADRGSDASIVEQGGSFVYYTEAGNPASRQEIPRVVEVDFERYGAYVEVGWAVTPDLKVIAGGRVDKDSRIEDLSYTPRGAIIYKVSDELTAKYTYSWAYISPAPYFGFATYDRGDVLNTSNPELQPETSKTHELSFTYVKEKLDLGLSLYYGEQSNLILVSDVGSQPNILQDLVFLDVAGTQPRTLT